MILIKPVQKLTLAMCFLALSPADAHHSRANFDRDQVKTLNGTIVDYSWRNPHVYIEIEVEEQAGVKETWLVEAHSVTGMKGNGWDKDTLVEGEQVTIVGSPDRNPAKRFLLIDTVQKPGGEPLAAFSRRPPADAAKPTIAPSSDFSGTWVIDFSRFNVREAGGGPPDWPYTGKGRTLADAFSVNDNPELQCLQIGVPKIVIYPYGINWTRDGNVIRIDKEHMDESRIVYLDPSVLDNMSPVPSYVGTSIGHFESERHLVIETTGFLPTRWGNANGVDSSAQKKVTENYVLAEDGMSIEISYTIDDPEYMTEPVTVTGGYFKQANRDFEMLGCDERAASRHLEAE